MVFGGAACKGYTWRLLNIRWFFVFPDTVTATLNDTVLAQAKSLSAEDRQMLVISYVPKAKEIWLIQGTEGFVMLEDNDITRLPVFPHNNLAQAWLDENQITGTCVAVPFDEFTETWLPGLTKNGVELVMFPTSADAENLVMTAEELSAEFSADASA